MSEEKAITLYLTTWQKRIVTDYEKAMAKNKHFAKIKLNVSEQNKFLYGAPMYMVEYMASDEIVKNAEWRLYLTDEQIHHVKDVLGIKTEIAALNISPEM